MSHLADPSAEQIGFILDAKLKFIAFVDHFSEEKDAIISYLALEEETGKLLIKTHTYRNPFQKRVFTAEENDDQWALTSEEIQVSRKIRKILEDSLKEEPSSMI